MELSDAKERMERRERDERTERSDRQDLVERKDFMERTDAGRSCFGCCDREEEVSGRRNLPQHEQGSMTDDAGRDS